MAEDWQEDIDYESIPNSSLATNLVAGALAGITEHSVMYPIDSIKTRMQVLAPSSSHAIYTGVGNALSKITTTEGFRALWRGVNSVIIGAGPAHALYFATYESCRSYFGADRPGHHIIASGAAGACATIVADAVMNPFDVIKQRMQVQGSTYRGIIECAASVLRNEGLSAFYISYPTTLSMTIPFQSVQFASYEYFRKTFNPRNEYDPKIHIISGGLAGAIAAAVTTPLDVAKTLLQTRGSVQDAEIRAANGLVDAFKVIYKKKGMKGFSKGLRPRIIAHMPATAICWATYEYFKWFINSGEGYGQAIPK